MPLPERSIQLVKTRQWALEKDLVEYEWRWFWRHCVFFAALWEGGGDEAFELVRRRSGTFTGLTASDWARTDVGDAMNFAGTTSDKIEWTDADDAYAINIPCSVGLHLRSNQSGNQVIFEKKGNDGFSVQNFNGIYLIRLGFDGIGPNEIIDNPAGRTYSTDGEWHNLLFSIGFAGTDTNQNRVFIDGIDDTDDGRALDPTWAGETVYLDSRNGSFVFAGDISYAFLLNGLALSTEQVHQIGNDPFGMLRKRRRRISIAAGITVNPALASVTARAFQPTVTGSGTATVTPAVATATAQAFQPAVAGSGTATVAANLASVLSRAFQPVSTGTGTATAAAALASVLARAFQPIATAGAAQTVIPALASALARAFQPAVTGSGTATVLPAIASVTAQAFQPIVTGTGIATVTPAIASAIAQAFQPATAGSGTATAVAAIASTLARAFQPATAGSGVATVQPALASVLARAFQPTVNGTGAAPVSPTLASVLARAFQPTVSQFGFVVIPNLASVTARAFQPAGTGSGTATVLPGLASVLSRAFQPAEVSTVIVQYGVGNVVIYREGDRNFVAIIDSLGTGTNVNLFVLDPTAVIAVALYFARSNVPFAGSPTNNSWSSLYREGQIAASQWFGVDATT